MATPPAYTSNQNRLIVYFDEKEIEEMIQGFRKLPKAYMQAKYMGSVLRQAIKPGKKKLKELTPKGPTGNLRRAVAAKTVRYSKQDYGWAVALAGYRRAGTGKSESAAGGSVRKGKDRGYHQGFVEFGTKVRFTEGSIASSFRTRGPFLLEKKQVRRRKVGKVLVNAPFRADNTVHTVPKLPHAFFKRAPDGQKVNVKKAPKQSPVKRAFTASLPAMRALMLKLAPGALGKATKEILYRNGRTGGKS